MNRRSAIAAGVSLIVMMAGCQNSKTRVGEGAAIGGLLGAAAGGIIGHQSGHGGEGVAIGVAAGILSGAVIGSQIDKNPQPPAQPAGAVQSTPAQVPQQAASRVTNNPNQMAIPQIVELVKQGVNEDVIVDRIRLTNSRFVLSGEDVQYLQQH